MKNHSEESPPWLMKGHFLKPFSSCFHGNEVLTKDHSSFSHFCSTFRAVFKDRFYSTVMKLLGINLPILFQCLRRQRYNFYTHSDLIMRHYWWVHVYQAAAFFHYWKKKKKRPSGHQNIQDSVGTSLRSIQIYAADMLCPEIDNSCNISQDTWETAVPLPRSLWSLP